jgi:hypothetical protein
MKNQTNGDNFVYAETLQNTLLETQSRALAHRIIAETQSTPAFVSSQLNSIKRRIAENKINTFTTTKRKVSELRELAKRAREITSLNMGRV